MSFITLGSFKATSEVVSSILNWVGPECGGRMGGRGKEFKCQGECRMDWRQVWLSLRGWDCCQSVLSMLGVVVLIKAPLAPGLNGERTAVHADRKSASHDLTSEMSKWRWCQIFGRNASSLSLIDSILHLRPFPQRSILRRQPVTYAGSSAGSSTVP